MRHKTILPQTPKRELASELLRRSNRCSATPSKDSETLFLLSRAYDCAGNSEEAQKTLAEFEASSQNDRTTKENQTQAKHLVQQANEQRTEK